jgi:cyclic-di-AMP phosphodiesterase PgpH
MRKIINYIVNNFEKIYIVSLFIIAYIIVILIFPGETRFRYEYLKGHPWHHKDLIAPFDYAVYKLDNELASERKEALLHFAPIYIKDNKTGKKQMEEFKRDFEAKWREWQVEYDSLKRFKLHNRTSIYHNDSVKLYFYKAQRTLENLYQQGILEYNENIGNPDSLPGSVRIINEKIATEINFKNIYTQKDAYSFLFQKLAENNPEGTQNKNLDFIRNMQLNRYILPNLKLDRLTTEKARKELMESISETRGIVAEGEKIISKGEMIDTDKFRKLESLKNEYQDSFDLSSGRSLSYLGRFIIVLFGFLMVYLFLKRFRDYVLESRRKTFFILLLIVSSIVLTHFVYSSDVLSIYLIPFIIVPILITTFYETRLALFIHLITVLIAGFYAPNSFEFIFIQFFAGMIAIIGLKKIQRRGQFFSATMLSVMSYFLLYFGFAINQGGNFGSIEWVNFAWFAGNGILVLLSFPMVYIFEKTFNFVSDITLLELSDSNQKLLRELAEKAPGTFQHSMQVANIAEEVVRIIGGNSLLIRTGALYHDIGKLSAPQYFTENQISGINPHENLSYTESSAIIINHVIAGYEMAKKAKLPSTIIDFILTHHGTTKTEYFYRLYKKEFPEDEYAAEKFMYPGPKPSTKETAVLMMCDATEAASRSLKQYDIQTIENLVESLIEHQIREKQFDEANITLAEINEAKRIIKNKLNSIYHARIEYPKA